MTMTLEFFFCTQVIPVIYFYTSRFNQIGVQWIKQNSYTFPTSAMEWITRIKTCFDSHSFFLFNFYIKKIFSKWIFLILMLCLIVLLTSHKLYIQQFCREGDLIYIYFFISCIFILCIQFRDGDICINAFIYSIHPTVSI